MITLTDVTKDKKHLKQVKRLYKSAFPANERPPFFMILNKAKKGKGELFAAESNGSFIGLANTVTHKQTVYLFFLAVDSAVRGKGYGSEILTEIKRRYNDKKIILCMEELDTSAKNFEERIKRKRFYERNGFNLSGIKSVEAGVWYDLLVYGGEITYEEFADLMKDYMGSLLFKLIFKQG
ncbi:MAG: GNAT family N-acetyltransferase [Clostridia bacterium]|nr:GNAT family N-acetyltransferase [Clostridia bacterium]